MVRQLVLVLALCAVACAQVTIKGQLSDKGQHQWGGGQSGATPAGYPLLPIVFVDNAELTCRISGDPSYPCQTGSPGNSLSAPTTVYTLTLTSGGGTWSPSVPPGSTTGSACSTHTYPNTAAGLQCAFNDLEAYRTNTPGTWLKLLVPPGTYSNTNGFILPQTASAVATSPIIVRSTMDSTLAGMPQPVCNGGVQPNLSQSVNIGLSNPSCDGNNLSYQLGNTVTEVTLNGSAASGITFPYALANGTSFANLAALQAAYNYAQYMPVLECTATTNCFPLTACSSTASITYVCANTTIGVNNWEIDDLAIGIAPGNPDPEPIVYTGGIATFTSLNQFASHLHFNRDWVFGDWLGNAATSAGLSAGTNNVSDAINLSGCAYCSVGNTSFSGILRPGGEGHAVLNQGYQTKIYNIWDECCSSSYFAGGFSNAPPLNYVPSTDVEIGPAHLGFPFGWLGFQCSGASNTVQDLGNACWNLPDSNYYWGGAGDNYPVTATSISSASVSGTTVTINLPGSVNVGTGQNIIAISGLVASNAPTGGCNGTYTVTSSSAGSFQYTDSNCSGTITMSGSAAATLANPVCNPTPGTGVTCVNVDGSGNVTYVSGPVFHDNNTSWNVGTKTVLINNDGTKYHIASITGGPCTAWPASTGCPTLLTLTTVPTGAPLTNVPFVFNSPSIVRKNGFELKETERMVVYGVHIQNVDQSGGQSGVAMTINTRNNSGGGFGTNYQSQINNLLFTNSMTDTTCEGIGVDARSAGSGNGGGVSYPMYNIWFKNILQFGLTNKNNVGCGTNSAGFDSSVGNQQWTGTVTENGTGTAATFVATIGIDPAAGGACNGGCNMESESISAPSSSTTTTASITTSTANTYISGETVNFVNINGGGTCLEGQAGVITSTGNPFTVNSLNSCTLTITSGTVQGPVGFQTFNIMGGTPAYVYNCGNSAFNMGTQTIGSFTVAAAVGTSTNPLMTIGSSTWTGTWSAPNTTVTYPWTAAANASTTCTLTNIVGNPNNLLVTNMTEITDNNQPFGEGPALSPGGPTFGMNMLLRDSIIVGKTASQLSASGWYNSSPNVEGMPNQATCTPPNCYGTENFNYDFHTMTTDHMVWPGRTNTLYVELGNNPNFPDSAGCSGNGCTPPSTLYFPATPWCTGSTPTSACVGFVGVLSASSMPLNPPSGDYHNYGLCSGAAGFYSCSSTASTFHNASSTGGDIGAIIPNIDSAMTTTQFVCPYYCAGPGPFKDF